MLKRRKILAAATMHIRELLVGDADSVAARADGTATIGGVRPAVGPPWGSCPRPRGQRRQNSWLLPLDAIAFDTIWRA